MSASARPAPAVRSWKVPALKPEERLLLRAQRATDESGVRRPVWRTAYIMRRFTAAQLASVTDLSVAEVRRYLKQLVEGGYLSLRPAGVKCEGSVNWYGMVLYTGPNPPRPVGRAHLYDPNRRLLVRREGRSA